MRFTAIHHLTPWVTALSAGAHFAAGLLLGSVYFASMSWQADRLASGGDLKTTIAMIVFRFLLLAGLLTLASLEGALPLLTMALGVLIARFLVMRHFRGCAA